MRRWAGFTGSATVTFYTCYAVKCKFNSTNGLRSGWTAWIREHRVVGRERSKKQNKTKNVQQQSCWPIFPLDAWVPCVLWWWQQFKQRRSNWLAAISFSDALTDRKPTSVDGRRPWKVSVQSEMITSEVSNGLVQVESSKFTAVARSVTLVSFGEKRSTGKKRKKRKTTFHER